MLQTKDLLVELIKTPSYIDSKNKIDENKISIYIDNFFRNLQKKDPALKVRKQVVEKRRFNIIVSKGEPKILFGFHMDTIPPPTEDQKAYKSLEVKEVGGKLYGRGSVDMKASIAVIMSLTKELLPNLNNFFFLFTVDEEYDFKGILKFLKEIKVKPQLAIFCEPTNLKISNANRGIMQLHVTVYGIPAHAGVPERGINAVELLVDAFKEVRDEIISNKFADVVLGSCSFNLAYLLGGKEGSYNSVPDKAVAVLDIRPTPKLTKEIVENLIKEKIKKKFKQKSQENKLDFNLLFREPDVKFDFIFGPLLTNKENLKSLETAVKNIVGKVEYITSFGVTEAGILSEKFGVPACNFGPGPAGTAHKLDECVNLADLELLKRIFSTLLLK